MDLTTVQFDLDILNTSLLSLKSSGIMEDDKSNTLLLKIYFDKQKVSFGFTELADEERILMLYSLTASYYVLYTATDMDDEATKMARNIQHEVFGTPRNTYVVGRY